MRERVQRTSCSDIDWSIRPTIPLLVRKRTVIRAISQFLHGETIAERICADLLSRFPDAMARRFLEMQLDDEVRHAEIYLRYLKMLGGVAPVEPALGLAADRILKWRGAPEAIILSCHVLLETESLRLGSAIKAWFSCPLYGAISAAIARDEARHIAFGKTYLRESLPALAFAERYRIYCWLKELWNNAAAGAFDTVVWTGIPHQKRRAFLERHWLHCGDWLISSGLINAEEVRRMPCA